MPVHQDTHEGPGQLLPLGVAGAAAVGEAREREMLVPGALVFPLHSE